MYKKDVLKIFVVEDDPTYLKFLQYVLGLNPDFEATFFRNGKEYFESVRAGGLVVKEVIHDYDQWQAM